VGVLPVVLIILAMKIPIVGLWAFVYWLIKEPTDEPDAERVRAKLPPRLPEPGEQLRPRRRGPHGGAAQVPPSPRRDPHPAPAPVPAPAIREAPTPPENVPGRVFPPT
jgi:hypothetical protein